jgi:homoserine kinase
LTDLDAVADAQLDGSTELVAGQSVTVEVPATSANLGPGFDCFGLALDWRETVQLDVIEAGYQIEVSGESADQLPRDESHLVLRSALVGLASLGVRAPGLRLRSHNTIPHGRGLGSSSAAIVAGLLAARDLSGLAPDPRWLLGHADAIEGHPDNVAAAIYGGFALAYDGADGVTVARGRISSEVALGLCIPEGAVGTHAARGLLPDVVGHGDAAANSGRAALLVHALAHDPDLLLDATRDWLHQDYRQRAMPRSYELMRSLRAEGLAAVISGAGPSVLVLGRDRDLLGWEQRALPGFRTVATGVGTGATVSARTPPSPHTRGYVISSEESGSLKLPKK